MCLCVCACGCSLLHRILAALTLPKTAGGYIGCLYELDPMPDMMCGRPGWRALRGQAGMPACPRVTRGRAAMGAHHAQAHPRSTAHAHPHCLCLPFALPPHCTFLFYCVLFYWLLQSPSDRQEVLHKATATADQGPSLGYPRLYTSSTNPHQSRGFVPPP
jgi:hypothetical protein